MSTVELYIYYRVRDPATAVPRVRAMQAALAADTGVTARLMRRSDDAPSETTTLMEVYAGLADPAGFEAALQRAVVAHALHEVLVPGTQRHTERFTCA